MKVDLTNDPAFAAAVRDGVREALLDPGFRTALFAEVARTAAEYVWLSRAQLSELLGGKSEKSIARWAKRHLLTVNAELGPKEPRYSLASVQKALESGAIRAKAPRTPKPVRNGTLAAGVPRRGVSINHN